MKRFFCISILLITGVCAANSLETPSHFNYGHLRRIPILEGGRYKPFDTFAGESIKTITGRWKFNGNDPIALYLLMMVREEIVDAEIVRVDYMPLKEALGLDEGKLHFSFNVLVSKFLQTDWKERISRTFRTEKELSRIEREVNVLNNKLNLMQAIISGEALTIVPPPPGSDENATWYSIMRIEGYPQPARDDLQKTYDWMLTAFKTGNAEEFERSSSELKERLAQLNPSLYSAENIDREVRYNRSRPFLKAWMYYLPAFFLFLISLSFAGNKLYWGAFFPFAAGFAYHTYGLLIRGLIAGRPPVTNMYESVVFAGWGIIAFAFVFELIYRQRWFVISASALGVAVLILADILPFDANIEPLQPVLRSNYWLIIHVLTITISYSAFALATALAHVVLAAYFYLPHRRELLKQLSLFIYRTLQAGAIFLAAGTVLGGVWAAESWGRFWGWDPKETWSLISLLGYMAILHARYTGWIRDFGTAVCSVLGFWLILMTWYGVNYILTSGLHTYGFGSGGVVYVLGYMLFETAFLLVVAWKYHNNPRFLAACLITNDESADKAPAGSEKEFSLE